MRLLLLLLLLAGAAAWLPAQDAGQPTLLKDNGLKFDSEGFSLKVKFQVQFRVTVQDERGNTGSGVRATNGRDFANFRVPHARMWLTGHIFDPSFQYRFRLNFGNPAPEMIELAAFRWALIKAVNLNAGQHKLPFDWEQLVPPDELQFIERSYGNLTFAQGFAKGIWIDGQVTRWIRYSGGIYNGVLRAQDDFRNKDNQLNADTFSAVIDNELMVALRLETHPFGDVPYGTNDLRPDAEREQFLFAAGLAGNWFTSNLNNPDLRGDTGASATGSGRSRVGQSTVAVTLDAHARFYGAALDIALYWRHTEFSNRGINTYKVGNKAGIGDLTDWGWSVEASYYLGFFPLSAAIRASHVDADEFWGADATLAFTRTRSRAIRPDGTEVGLGVNYYIHGERLKASLDVNYISQQLAFSYRSGTRLTGVYNQPPVRKGTLGSNPPNADYNVLWIVRLQIQWLF